MAWTELEYSEPLSRRLGKSTEAPLALYWLGQAGFVIRAGGVSLVIDPYLSDSLADKYRGKPLPHERMMPAPVTPAGLGAVEAVLCTHHHTDHMDPATLSPLAANHSRLRFVVPEAARDEARRRIGVDDGRLWLMDAGRTVEIRAGVTVTAVRAAHESLDTDAKGHHRYLGYAIRIGERCIFHSGDTTLFPGYAEEVAALRPDLALLPVNGRSEALHAAGVPGNLTLAEATALCAACGIPAMIAHHFGMFAFNTVDPDIIDRRAAQPDLAVRLMRARTQVEYRSCFP